MGTYMDGIAFRKNLLGRKVDRATATLPATATEALFTVATGRIILTSIVGEVTTVVQTQACNASLISTPTVGTAVLMCAVLDITASEVGALFGISGLNSDALTILPAGGGLTILPYIWQVIPIGQIGLITSATNTGAIKWSMTYFPYDDGAAVVAA